MTYPKTALEEATERLFTALVGVALLTGGIWLVQQEVVQDLYSYRTQSWSRTYGVMNQGVTWYCQKGSSVNVADYSYTVSGVEYRGERFTVNSICRIPDSRREQQLQQYTKGAQVVVRYDPRDPASAVLEPGFFDFNLLAVGLVLLYCSFLVGRSALHQELP